MRIVSLLPSATEIVYALGLGDSLVGVTHECDWPPEARYKPVVSLNALPDASTPAEIDQLVSQSLTGGESIYRLDGSAIRDLRPDLVLSQDLCAVCAVPSGHVNDALAVLGCTADVLSLDPGSLEEVFACIGVVGQATGTETRATDVVEDLRRRLGVVATAVEGLDRSRTFALEWSDPPFNGGHWVPEMIERAGGQPVLGCPGSPSVRVPWEQIAEAAPEIVVFMPCGYDVDRASAEAESSLMSRPELSGVSGLYAVDANAFFSRPGPRLVDGVEILATVLHPEAFGSADPSVARRLI